MDPYLERAVLWPDFHDSLIAELRRELQPLLRPKYVAPTQDRLFVVQSDRPIRPDVAVIEAPASPRSRSDAAAVVADEPIVLEIWREEIREPYIQIVEPAAGNRVVTAIEVLSPDNKSAGMGRDLYIQKREEFWLAGTHLVEIDLLRAGLPTVRVNTEELAKKKQIQPQLRRYLIAVTRMLPSQQEIYPVALERPLPRVRIPLASQDPDVVLDLQLALERAWDAGPYPELLQYQNPPPGDFTAEELAFCRQTVSAETS
jgi:hypothetical protein